MCLSTIGPCPDSYKLFRDLPWNEPYEKFAEILASCAKESLQMIRENASNQQSQQVHFETLFHVYMAKKSLVEPIIRETIMNDTVLKDMIKGLHIAMCNSKVNTSGINKKEFFDFSDWIWKVSL